MTQQDPSYRENRLLNAIQVEPGHVTLLGQWNVSGPSVRFSVSYVIWPRLLYFDQTQQGSAEPQPTPDPEGRKRNTSSCRPLRCRCLFFGIFIALADKRSDTHTCIQTTCRQAHPRPWVLCIAYMSQTHKVKFMYTFSLMAGDWDPGQCVIRLCLQPSLDLNYHPSLGACAHLSSSRNLGESEGGMSSLLSHKRISSEQNTPAQSNVQLELITLMIQHAVGCFSSRQWGLLGSHQPWNSGILLAHTDVSRLLAGGLSQPSRKHGHTRCGRPGP